MKQKETKKGYNSFAKSSDTDLVSLQSKNDEANLAHSNSNSIKETSQLSATLMYKDTGLQQTKR